MKHYGAILLAFVLAVSCGKENVNYSQLYGTWNESYDVVIFSVDGSSTVTLNPGGTYTLKTAALLSGTTETSGKFVLDLFGSRTITFDPDAESAVTYRIVNLTSSEMTWQKYGTSYSIAGIGTDYKRFVRSSN